MLSIANHATKCKHRFIGPVDQAAAVINVITCVVCARHYFLKLAAVYGATTYMAFTFRRGKPIYKDPIHLSSHVVGAIGVTAELLNIFT